MAKYLPHGTTFKFNAISVLGIISVSTPERQRGDAETTDSASTFDRSFLPGLRNGGQVTIRYRHNPSDPGQQQLDTNYATNGSTAVKTCIITLPTGTATFTFDGFVVQPGRADLNLIDDAVAECTAVIKVTGPVTVVS